MIFNIVITSQEHIQHSNAICSILNYKTTTFSWTDLFIQLTHGYKIFFFYKSMILLKYEFIMKITIIKHYYKDYLITVSISTSKIIHMMVFNVIVLVFMKL